MKTIEERAKKYTKKNFVRIAEEMSIEEGMKTIFIESAKEQREIDIERACEYLLNTFEGGGYVQDYQIDEFRRAMKGE